MTLEEKARQVIDARLTQSGWVLQDLQEVNPMTLITRATRDVII